ncbi:MAG: M10 family metallopeptidase [Prochloraceae cyanobacterium]
MQLRIIVLLNSLIETESTEGLSENETVEDGQKLSSLLTAEINSDRGDFFQQIAPTYLANKYPIQSASNLQALATTLLDEIKDLATDKSNLSTLLNAKIGWIGDKPSQQQQPITHPLACSCPMCSGYSQTINGSSGNAGSLANTPQQSYVGNSTGDYQLDAVLGGYKWDIKTITYSFYDDDIPNSYYGSETVSEVSEAIKNNVRNILKNYIEPFVDLKFVEVQDSQNSYGLLRYHLTQMGNGYAYAYYPTSTDYNQGNGRDIAGDVHLTDRYDVNDGYNGFQSGPGSHGFATLIHETLHALGLKHPGNYNGGGTGNPPFLPYGEDNTTNTVMTYNFTGEASTPMLYDVKALQYLYGANQSHNSGDTTYSFDKVYAFSDGTQYWGSANKSTKVTIWDVGGTDTLDFSKLEYRNSGYYFDLRQGGILTPQTAYNGKSYNPRGGNGQYQTSSYGTVIADNVIIEKLIGTTSNDYIIANDAENIFTGYNPTIQTGKDTIVGANKFDILDLSKYSYSDVTQTTSGDDLIINLGSNGSIEIQDYYKLLDNNRIQILFDGSTSPTEPPTNPTTTPPRQTDLVWENQGLVDEAAVSSGSRFNFGGDLSATVDWSIQTNGGSFVPYAGNDFVSYESGTKGAHQGYLNLGFNNTNNDPGDKIHLSISFSQPIVGLNFDVLDVDARSSFDDGVEIWVDGINIRDMSDAFTLPGSSVMLDNENYMTGFEGRSRATNSSTNGNIQVALGNREVSKVEIYYFSTDDPNSNPSGQSIGISDLNWNV